MKTKLMLLILMFPYKIPRLPKVPVLVKGQVGRLGFNGQGRVCLGLLPVGLGQHNMLNMQAVGDTDQPGPGFVDLVAAFDAHLNGLTVALHHNGDAHSAQHRTGDSVGVHGGQIQLLEYPLGGGAGVAQANTVAMGLRTQIQHHHPLGLDAAGGGVGAEGARNIGVHAVAAEVFADLVHHQYVALIHQNAGHVGKRLFQQFGFHRLNVLSSHGGNLTGLLKGILNGGYAKENGGIFQNAPAKQGQVFGHIMETLLVNLLRAVLLAQTDGHHLHHAAFIAAPERGVRLNPAAQNNAVRLGGVFVNKDLLALGVYPDFLHLHGGNQNQPGA